MILLVLCCRTLESRSKLDLIGLRGGERLVTRRSCPFEGQVDCLVIGGVMQHKDQHETFSIDEFMVNSERVKMHCREWVSS